MLGEAGLLGQLDKQTDRLVGYAVLRIVQVVAGTLGREAPTASGVDGEQITQRGARDLALMGCQITQAGRSVKAGVGFGVVLMSL